MAVNDFAHFLADQFGDVRSSIEMTTPSDLNGVLDGWVEVAVNRGDLDENDYSIFVRVVIQLILDGTLQSMMDHNPDYNFTMPRRVSELPILHEDEFRSSASYYARKRAIKLAQVAAPID